MAAALQLTRSDFSLALRLRHPPPAYPRRLSCPLRCRLPSDDDGSGSGGEESTESLFLKELRRRGMTPTSLLEDSDQAQLGQVQREMEAEEEVNGGRGERTNRNWVASAEYEKGTLRQRERSMALNSEGLEGLIPRAKLLLTIGGTFFWGFWPLILVTIGLFTALYLASFQFS